MSDECLETRQVKAIDVVPYEWALWSSVEGGKPFRNLICTARWSEDGEHIYFGLDSHNFLKAAPDEVLELVPAPSGSYRSVHWKGLGLRPVKPVDFKAQLAAERGKSARIRRETLAESIRAIDEAFERDEDVAPQDVLRALASKEDGT